MMNLIRKIKRELTNGLSEETKDLVTIRVSERRERKMEFLNEDGDKIILWNIAYVSENGDVTHEETDMISVDAEANEQVLSKRDRNMVIKVAKELGF